MQIALRLVASQVREHLELFGRLDAKSLLETERSQVIAKIVKGQVGGDQTKTG